MITVVSGLPRSGTSLAMQLLEAAGIPPFTDGQRQADASNPQGYYEAEVVKTLPLNSAWLGEAEGVDAGQVGADPRGISAPAGCCPGGGCAREPAAAQRLR